jgi:RES domain-containing protein
VHSIALQGAFDCTTADGSDRRGTRFNRSGLLLACRPALDHTRVAIEHSHRDWHMELIVKLEQRVENLKINNITK